MGNYKLIDTQSGLKSLVYSGSQGSEVKLHSAYDPVKESERITSSFNPGRSNLIIVAGLALAYHVLQLKKRFPEFIILVIEKDKEVIDLVRKNYPENISGLPIINSPDDISTLENVDISTIKGVSAYLHRPSYMLDKVFYETILKSIKEYISSRVSDLLTRFEFEENWINNIFRNAGFLYSAVYASDLFGKFRGIPGIIVSAGPSLKKNAALLNDLKDKALIVCVDTAAKVLIKHNVTPHIIMTLDSQKYSRKHFLGIKENGAVLLADIVSYPRIIESYRGNIILSTTTKYFTGTDGSTRRETTPLWDWIEMFTGPIGDIQSGGSVATSVFDFLLNLGCSQIILVGQDLAYTGREIHCTGTYHNEEWLPKLSRFYNLETINQSVIRKRKIKYVDAYGGKEKVISDFIFDIYKNWFRDSAKKVNIPVINSTEGGARIENTKEIPLNKLAPTIKIPDKTPGKILQELMNIHPEKKIRKSDNLIAGINRSLEKLQKINTGSSEEEVLGLLESSISKLLTPFMRRTFVYLSRHADLPESKCRELLIADINNSSIKLARMLKQCKINIEKIR